MRVRSLFAAVTVACCLGTSALAANPMYDSWASHKPGTSVTLNSTSEVSGMKTESEIVYTLKEVTPEKAVIEVKTTTNAMGQKIESPATTMDIPSAGAGAAQNPTNAQAGAAGADVKTSEETVKVAGKEYKATCTVSKSDANGAKTEAKTWTSPEIPGTILKMESTSSGQMAMSTKMEVTKVELK